MTNKKQYPNLQIISHPIISHRITMLRNSSLGTKAFREVVKELSSILIYEATRHLATTPVLVKTWQGDVPGVEITNYKLNLVPILRAGLGMLDGVLAFFPSSKVSMIGLQRNEVTATPEFYYQKFAKDLDKALCVILDPMLATGGSMSETVNYLIAAGAKEIICLNLICAPEGVKKMLADHPKVKIFSSCYDDRLDSNSFIIPGLGDAGDRIFGTN